MYFVSPSWSLSFVRTGLQVVDIGPSINPCAVVFLPEMHILGLLLHQTVEKLISLVGAASICANAVKQPPILQVFLGAYTLKMVRNIISRTYGTYGASCF